VVTSLLTTHPHASYPPLRSLVSSCLLGTSTFYLFCISHMCRTVSSWLYLPQLAPPVYPFRLVAVSGNPSSSCPRPMTWAVLDSGSFLQLDPILQPILSAFLSE
jgi:hypothetical protein